MLEQFEDRCVPTTTHFHLITSGTATAGTSFAFTVEALTSSNTTDTSFTDTVRFVSSDHQAVLPANYTFLSGDSGVHSFTATLKTSGSQTISIVDVDQPHFSQASGSPLTAGTKPVSVVATDIDGDGIPDLVVANYSSGSIMTFHGNGDGTFAAGQTDPNYPGAAPASLALGDLNNDGNIDVVASDKASFGAVAMLNNANGTFTESLMGTLGYPGDAVVSDLNGDGIPDIATIGNKYYLTSPNVVGKVAVLIGNGNGTFQTPINQTVGNNVAQGIAVGDFTGDGKPDLAVTNGTTQLQILLGNGNGTFQTPTNISLSIYYQAYTVQAFVDPSSTHWDLALSTESVGINYVSILRGNGNGTFAPPLVYSFGGLTAYPMANFEVADVNGDGIPDLIVPYTNGSQGTVSVLLGQSNGTFGPAFTFATGTDPSNVFVADLNGDSLADLAVTNSQSNNVTVLLQTTMGSATVSVSSGAVNSLTITGEPSSITAGSTFPLTVKALDVYGNPVTAFTNTIHFTSTDSAASLPSNDTLTNGVGVFTASLNTVASETITATDTASGSLTATTSGITVFATPVLVVTTSPTTVTAGVALTNVFVDAYVSGSPDTNYNGTVDFTSSDGQAVLPADTALSSGTLSFAYTVVLKTAGTQTFTATDIANSGITASATVTVNPASVATFAITGAPSSVPVSYAFSITVTAVDAYGNTVTSYGGTVDFSSTDSGATLPASSTLTSGVGTFSCTLATAGSQTLTATDHSNGTITCSTAAITVGVGPLAQFGVVAEDSNGNVITSAYSYTSFQLIITAQDQYGQTVTTFEWKVDITFSDAHDVNDAATNVQLDDGVGVYWATLNDADGAYGYLTVTIFLGPDTSTGVTGTGSIVVGGSAYVP